MRDDDIIKILEYCVTDGWCSNCPHEKKCIEDEITALALKLIKAQRAEIKSKTDLIHRQGDVISEQKEKLERIYTEAVKEFAAKLKAKINRPEHPWEDSPVCESDIDEVLKEMVGER